MKNTLTDLNNYLFETIERILDDNLSPEQLDAEIKRSQAVTGVARTIISNGELTLKAMQHAEEFNIGTVAERRTLPPMLEAPDETETRS